MGRWPGMFEKTLAWEDIAFAFPGMTFISPSFCSSCLRLDIPGGQGVGMGRFGFEFGSMGFGFGFVGLNRWVDGFRLGRWVAA